MARGPRSVHSAAIPASPSWRKLDHHLISEIPPHVSLKVGVERHPKLRDLLRNVGVVVPPHVGPTGPRVLKKGLGNKIAHAGGIAFGGGSAPPPTIIAPPQNPMGPTTVGTSPPVPGAEDGGRKGGEVDGKEPRGLHSGGPPHALIKSKRGDGLKGVQMHNFGEHPAGRGRGGEEWFLRVLHGRWDLRRRGGV